MATAGAVEQAREELQLLEEPLQRCSNHCYSVFCAACNSAAKLPRQRADEEKEVKRRAEAGTGPTGARRAGQEKLRSWLASHTDHSKSSEELHAVHSKSRSNRSLPRPPSLAGRVSEIVLAGRQKSRKRQ